MNTIISVVVLFLIVIIAIGFVLTIGNPIIDAVVDVSDIKSAEDDLHTIDSYIRVVVREGKDSVRVFKFTSPKSFELIQGEDAVQFSANAPVQLVEYLTRTFAGNFVYISGSDVNCQEKDADGDGSTDLVAENSRLQAVFNKVPSGTIYTDYLIKRLVDKTNNISVFVGNASIEINENTATSSGSGYSEISHTGTNLPVCQIHAFVNSSIDYDVYYKLYAGADFLVAEVRNIVVA